MDAILIIIALSHRVHGPGFKKIIKAPRLLELMDYNYGLFAALLRFNNFTKKII